MNNKDTSEPKDWRYSNESPDPVMLMTNLALYEAVKDFVKTNSKIPVYAKIKKKEGSDFYKGFRLAISGINAIIEAYPEAYKKIKLKVAGIEKKGDHSER